MLVRPYALVLLACVLQGTAARAEMFSQVKLSDPRADFVRLCAPHMLGRWAHPESVCGCLHDYAAAVVEDNDLRLALLRGSAKPECP
jgi:hypothetical protein